MFKQAQINRLTTRQMPLAFLKCLLKTPEHTKTTSAIYRSLTNFSRGH